MHKEDREHMLLRVMPNALIPCDGLWTQNQIIEDGSPYKTKMAMCTYIYMLGTIF